MTHRQYRSYFENQLQPLYSQAESRSILGLLLEDLCGYTRSQILMSQESVIDENHVNKLNQALSALKKGVPVQHVTGIAHFYGRTFRVSPHTLIPRQETEELVALIVKEFESSTRPLRILDIGTGTGCIGISLAKMVPNAQVTLLDVSEQALEIAKHNAAVHDVKVTLLKSDILQIASLATEYDLIVSNPPYVRDLEKQEIQKNVKDFEPHLALFVSNEDPLVFYRKILELAKKQVSLPIVYFEINQYLSDEMKSLANTMGARGQLHKDLNDNWRMMRCDFDPIATL